MTTPMDITLLSKINELIEHMKVAKIESEAINNIKNELAKILTEGVYYHEYLGQTWVITVNKADPRDRSKLSGFTVSLKPATKIE